MAHVPIVGPMARPARNAIVSWVAVALVPVMFGLWFWLAMALIGDPNEPTAPHGWNGAWRVLVLWVAVEVVPVVGIIFGRRATRRHEVGGRAPLITNMVIFLGLTLTTLVGGLSDAFG